MASKINLFKFIVNEGLQFLQENKGQKSETGEDVQLFLNHLKVTNLELLDIPVNKNLIGDLHKVSDEIKQTYVRKKERRDSIKEKRRASLTPRRSSLDNVPQSNLRRKSESSLNFRRKSSGNVESFQNRLKNSNYLKPEPIERGYFFKLNTTSDSRQNLITKNLPPLQQNQAFSDGSQNTEIMKKPALKAQRSDQKLGSELDNSEGKTTRKESSRKHYNRYQSWSGGHTLQESKTNWRMKE